MDQLPHLLVAVQRAVRLRTFVRTFATWVIVVGTLSVLLALALPAVPRWHALVGLGVALLAALGRALTRHDAPLDLVTYVDQRLDAGFALVSSFEGGAHVQTQQQAQAALHGKTARDVRPRVLDGEWLGIAFYAAALLAVYGVPLPPPVRRPPGAESVTLAIAPALTRVAELPRQARDEAQRAQLERAAQEAEALRQRLSEGMPRREALDGLHRVREEVAQARRADTPERQRAREAATDALAGEREMARALAERDLESLSRAVQRAAGRREAADRERARQALTQAAEAARAAGDNELADGLLRQRDTLDRRSQQAALARQLAEAMPETQRAALDRTLERLARDGDAEGLNQAMVDAMAEAWRRLTPEERQRLGNALADGQAAENDQAAAEAADDASPPTADEMEQQLRDALAALDDMQRQVGGAGDGSEPQPGGMTQGGRGGGIPVARQGQGEGQGEGRGQGQGTGQGQGSGQGNSGSGSGTGGAGQGGGEGPEGGQTDVLPADSPLLGRVRPTRRAGSPSRSWVEWVDPQGSGAPAGEVVGTGTAVAGSGGQGVERAPIPREYREHVREFFGGDE
jgi:hypothetical protein